MELTDRDRKITEDIALHGVMTRDQVLGLGYFDSIPRANARLLTIVQAGLLTRVPMNPRTQSRQAIYRASRSACGYVDPRVGELLKSRHISPMQIDHQLAVVDTRIKLQSLGAIGWLAEPQCRHQYTIGAIARREDLRPDGLAFFGSSCLFVEVDRGNVALPRIREKLKSYATYARSGMFKATYSQASAALLVVTTGARRRSHILRLLDRTFPMPVFVHTVNTFNGCSALIEVTR